LKDEVGYPYSKKGSIFKPPDNPKDLKNFNNPAFKTGAALTLVIISD
jgi:hypothetical protein